MLPRIAGKVPAIRPARSRRYSEQLQEHDIRDEAALRIAADGLADVETQQGSVWPDRLSCDADALEQLAAEIGEGLLIRVVFREDAPRLPVRARVVIEKSRNPVAPP